MSTQELNPGFWNSRYKAKNIGWDIGSISTPLKEYFDTLSNKDLSILIPGAGNCYEGEYLLNLGFTGVTVLDYAPEAIENFRKRVSQHQKAKLICADFFTHRGQYDLIVEQTFFCALNPALRKDYAVKMHQLLKHGGKLAGLLFTDVPNEEGPPFGGSREEYLQLFSEKFIIEKLEPCKNSIKPRSGRELFIMLGPKA
ncbi:MAG TPA: methyltransferase domain-containing protein [Bacteroidia bacterium]|jgi:SAM-dependent methyltransferase|nr:methyltransferase domain-containing protein [Bacteroidia bacterium]